jgi:phosphoribosylformimino-5-aminoimidazole carboxamide ribotide isomerase
MLILPAIDLRKGKVVRLKKGNYSQETIYSSNPANIAKKWQELGAKMLHIVDLDGALTGEMENVDSLKNIIEKIDIPIEVGGGIRSYQAIAKLINLGVNRVILSTVACEDRPLLKKAINDFSDHIAVSLDAKDGKIYTRGWKESTDIDVINFASQLEAEGLKYIIYTDIAIDGTLSGVNAEEVKKLLSKVNIPVIVSGGVSSIEDLRNLKKIENLGLEGVIIGKALYDNKISLPEALRV